MARPEKVFVTSVDSRRVFPLTLQAGETRTVTIDWNQLLGELDTTISTSCFTSYGLVGIADQAISDGTTSVNVSASNAGTDVLQNCVVLVDGQTLGRTWYVKVQDPTIEFPLISDYQQ